MSHRYNNLFSFVLLIVAGAAICSPTARADESPLRMTVVIEPTTIHVYEAVPITVIFQNTGQKEFPVHFHAFRMGRGVGTVEVRDPAGVMHILREPRYYESPPHEAYWPVKPGDEFRVSFLLACGDLSASKREPIFTTPGKYMITVDYTDRAADAGSFRDIEFKRTDYPDIHLKSEPLVIEVLDAPGTERRALELVKRLEPQIMLYEPNYIPAGNTRPYFESARRALRQIASVKESQVYANYARHSLASHHVRGTSLAGYSPMYDFDEEAKAAREMLDAIDTKGFTLADGVEKLRTELEAIIKSHDKADTAQKP